MPSLKEFQTLLVSDWARAIELYVVTSDEKLDFIQLKDSVEWLLPRKIMVTPVFTEPNCITMSAAALDDTNYYWIWYLPWQRGFVTSMTLDGAGPDYFSTSQLSGCRFTIQYADSSRKKVTVIHGAGNLSRQEREDGEATVLTKAGNTGLTRRYSATIGRNGLRAFVKDDSRVVYDGDKAWIFGVRTTDGAWNFYAQQQTNSGGFKGIKPLR